MSPNPKILIHPITKEAYSITEWAEKLGIDPSSMSCRYKKYQNDEKTFYPKSYCCVRWTEEEDELLKETWMLPNALQTYNKEARKRKLPIRKEKAIESRIYNLRKQGEILIKKGNLELAIKAGALNETQLARCLSISSKAVEHLYKNGLIYTVCKQSHYRFIELKDFASWAITPKGSQSLAKAISQDRRAIAWVLEIIGEWLWR